MEAKKKCRKHCFEWAEPRTHECDACCKCGADKFEEPEDLCYGNKPHEYGLHMCDCDVCDYNGLEICIECQLMKP